MNIYLLLTILAIISFVSLNKETIYRFLPLQLGGGKPFSDVGEYLTGIPDSVDGQPALPDTRKWAADGYNFGIPAKTYYAHGIPLKHEDRAPGPTYYPMQHGHNLKPSPKCSPKCCPSPYSCDHGCVCTTMENM